MVEDRGDKRDARRFTRFWVPAIVGLMSTALTLSVWLMLVNHDQRFIGQQLEIDVAHRVAAIQLDVSRQFNIIDAVVAFYAGSQAVERDEFHAFTAPLLERYTGTESIQFVQRVAAADRATHEEALRAEVGDEYRVWSARPPTRLDVHYPVLYVEPATRREMLGFDWASDPIGVDTLEAVLVDDLGTMMSPPFGAAEGNARVIVAAPVYRKDATVDTTWQRRDQLEGFVVGSFPVHDVVKSALAPWHDADIRLAVHDAADRDGAPLYSTMTGDAGAIPADAETTSGRVQLPERTWIVTAVANEAYGRSGGIRTAQIALIGGLFTTVLLVSYLITLAGRTERVHRLVDERTAELRRSETQLRVARDAAEQASRTKSEFLANMSHEIRTPMNGVIGMIELLRKTEVSPQQREYLLLARQSAEALLQLLNDVLDFSKIEAGKLELERIRFPLRDVVGDALRSMALKAAEKDIELAVHVPPHVPDVLTGDPVRLRQVIVNLVGNAVKFTHDGEIVVELDVDSCDNRDVVLHVAVRDTGEGIAPDKQRRIFEAFEQAETSTTRRFGGTGLGLAICREIVERMGGRMWVQSEPGRGSTFHFTVRMEVGAQDGPVDMSHAALRDLAVLVVDDHETNRIICQEMLDSWGMLAATASDAADALHLLRAGADSGRPYRLVVLDNMMPGMDGYALARAIRDAPGLGSPLLIMLTSAGRPDDAERCAREGIADCLLKPVKETDLRAAVLRALDASAPAAEPAEEQAARSVTPLRILLAEDGLVNQRVAVSLLEQRGHEVVVASDGAEAVGAVAGESFDLVLMDVQMPVMDGFEATQAIRRDEQRTGVRVPIIAMTAHAMRGDRERCLAAGMDGYLSKPIRPQELYDTVESAALLWTGTNGTNGAAATGIGDACDLDVALERVGGDRTTLQHVATTFLEESPMLLGALRDAIESGDADAVQRAGHRLRGCLDVVAAGPASAVARRLEGAGRTGDLGDADTLLIELTTELQRLEETMATVAG